MELSWAACFVLLCLIAESVVGLECWQCLGDYCDLEPSDNDNAKTSKCFDGQTCQKVYFEMLDDKVNVYYRSTVRGCASYCSPRNDFDNCTFQQRSTIGCVRKDCCSDGDLCNGGNHVTMPCVILVCSLCASLLFNQRSG